MIYNNIYPGIFISRPNRFIAHIEIEGRVEICHVKNTGRCRELLIPGVPVYVQLADNPNRKTKYDLISVQKGNRLINMDSAAPNKVFGEWLASKEYFGETQLIKPESTYGNSRFDFYIETPTQKIYTEVKGVTLEEADSLLFPDAPTLRGVKHIQELCRCKAEGYGAAIAFIIQMEGALYFTPNRKTHPEFGQALEKAAKAGVEILALDCLVTENSLSIHHFIPVKLHP